MQSTANSLNANFSFELERVWLCKNKNKTGVKNISFKIKILTEKTRVCFNEINRFGSILNSVFFKKPKEKKKLQFDRFRFDV